MDKVLESCDKEEENVSESKELKNTKKGNVKQKVKVKGKKQGVGMSSTHS